MGLYNELDTYVIARVAELNATLSGTVDDLVKIDADLDPDMLPENQKHNRYMLKIDKYEDRQTEAPSFDIDLTIELKFLLPNNDTSKYLAVIDNYIHVLVMKIYRTNKYSVSGFSFECTKVGASDLNNFGVGEFQSEYSPKINLTGLMVIT